MTDQPLTEQLYEVPLNSGELVYVKPLSPLAYQVMLDKAIELYPEPDPKDYELPLENAFVDGLTKPAEHNREYVERRQDAHRKQLNWVYDKAIRSGIVVDTPEGKEATVQRFAAQLTYLRENGNIAEDDWTATVLYCLIVNREDIRIVVEASRETIRKEDIRAAIKSFRRPLQRPRSTRHPGAKAASRITQRNRETAEAGDQL